jgi:glycosyltransferase involved in cell wall biosynthesis
MTKLAFAIPGDIGLPTGGYAYDRHVLALLPAHGIEARHLPLPGSFPFPAATDIAETERLLMAAPADVVLLIDGLALGAMPAALVARVRQPVVALCHHPLALESGLSEDRARALYGSERAALALARHVVVTSPSTARILAADFGVAVERITVAEPGTEPAPRAARAGDPVELLAVGSVVPRKGYDVLVRALAALRERRWRSRIAGAIRDSRTAVQLEAQIRDAELSDRIELLEAVASAELAELYAAADIFVMPSLFEGYGMALAEAMARGLPIVCTTGGAAAETVPDAAAIKVPPGDVAALGSALARVLDDKTLRDALSDASWAAGQRLPRWSDTARIIAGVIGKALP